MYDPTDEPDDSFGYDESEPWQPDESDLTTSDHVNFYQDGKCVLTLVKKVRTRDYDGKFVYDTVDAESGDLSDVEMWKQLDAYMKRTNYFPNVWFISDHGNAHLMERPKRSHRRRR